VQKDNCKNIKKDSGNAMLITTILLLVMTVIVGACMNIAGMQFDLSLLQRNTSNTYYLAKSGVEKQVDFINKAIQTEMADIIEKDIREKYLDPITISKGASLQDLVLQAATGESYDLYKNIKYDQTEKKLKLVSHQTPSVTGDTLLRDTVQEALYNFMKENIFDDPTKTSRKIFKYKVKSDRQAKEIETDIIVWAEPVYELQADGAPNLSAPKEDRFKIISEATSKDPSGNVIDTQNVEAEIALNLPEKIDNEVREKYEWVGNPPEILDSAITCFSDMVVTNEAALTVTGDIRIKGNKNTASGWPDIDTNGGIIVSNGGHLKTDNIYCMNNVAATNGWGTGFYDRETKIEVSGDIIADTVGIFDDYYSGGANQEPFGADPSDGNKVRNSRISVDKNIFVDNDVKIDPWVATLTSQSSKTQIEAKGSIFGISNNNNGATGGDLDPNSSSGVYNQGIDTLITAKQMFVYGQPFISFAEGAKPIRLWESIGEPFNGVATLEKYNRAPTDADYQFGDDSYLQPDSPTYGMIENKKIGIQNINESYATAYISANSQTIRGDEKFIDQSSAGQLFNLGGYFSGPTPIDLLTAITPMDNAEGRTQKLNIIQDPTKYYIAATDLLDLPSMYKKFYAPPLATDNKWQGLKAYMTAMRSIFYGLFDGSTPSVPQELYFNDVVELASVLNTNTWSYRNPIEMVTNAETILIDKYYVEDDKVSPSDTERPYPTIIINKSNEKLTLTTNGKNTFRGIIISGGDVEIQGQINIEGAVIIKGENEGAVPKDRKYMMLGKDTKGVAGEQPYSPGLLLSDSGTNVTITQNPNILLEMDFADRSYLREVMDALKITQYKEKTTVGEILGPYNYDRAGIQASDLTNPVVYTMGRVLLSKDSVLDIKTNKIDVAITSMKKVN
jgi:hypothetical protein